jgi:hypothetical protein
MSSGKGNEGHLIQRVNRYVSALGKCPVVKACAWRISRNTCREAAKETSSSEVSPMNATTVQEAKKNFYRLNEKFNSDE